MTKTRLYDVYFRIDDKWMFQLRTFRPFTRSEQLKRGNIAKNIPCRQRFYSGWDSRERLRVAFDEGFTSGFWMFEQSLLMRGLDVW